MSEVGQPPRVVIVGGGFGGLWTVRGLRGAPADVTLINDDNYHTFSPLLYQVAAAELEPEEIVYPIRSFLRSRRTRFVLGEVTRLDAQARRVSGRDFAVDYDYLVLAAGSVSHFFGVDGAAEYAFGLKTLSQAIRLRNHILSSFERAACERDAACRARCLSFVIVGGGPTGVEFAGALAELVRGPLRRDFPELPPPAVRIVLVEAQAAILPGLPERLQRYTLRRLRQMGVEVRLRAAARQVTPDAIALDDRGVLPTRTVVWTAGVQGTPAARTWGLPVDRSNRVSVRETLQVVGHPEIYVVGDLASPAEVVRPLPMVAPVAIQQGACVARSIRQQLQHRAPEVFRYRDPGTMVTIGRNAAVALVKRKAVTGFPAWILWLSVHLFKLIGFRNRLLVLVNWAWDYFLYERAVRLILPRGDAADSLRRIPPRSGDAVDPADHERVPGCARDGSAGSRARPEDLGRAPVGERSGPAPRPTS